MNAATQNRDFAETRNDNFVFSPVRGRNRAKSFELVPGGQAGISMGMKSASLILTDVEFCGWLGQAAPGDILEYHRGYLALDASPNGGSLGDHERRELGRVARHARWAAERQLVHLVQRRHAANDFSYLAIARPRPKTIPASSLLLEEVA